MQEQKKGFCPFNHRTSSTAAYANLTLPQGKDARLTALKEFVGSESFICRVATLHEKAGILSYVSLNPERSPGDFIRQLKEPVSAFLKKETGALIIQFPDEPVSYHELAVMKQNLCGQFVCTALMERLWEKQDLMLEVAKGDDFKGASLSYKNSNEPGAITEEGFLNDIIVFLSKEVSNPDFNFEKTLAKYGNFLYEKMPNIAPMLGNERQLQQIVMSRLYHQSQIPVACPVSEQYEIGHGRFAPSTCLVISYVDEVNSARKNAAGAVTESNVAGATMMYNGYAGIDNKYFPSEILARAFGFKPGAKPDQILMADYHGCLERVMSSREQGRKIESVIEMLPPAVQKMVRLMGADKDPELLMALIKRMNESLEHLTSFNDENPPTENA